MPSNSSLTKVQILSSSGRLLKFPGMKKDGKSGLYTIDKEFLNSLGVQGTFDADFYIEVERIASGDVENTFVNIVNGQEMESKVTTHTPEPLKPQEPKNLHFRILEQLLVCLDLLVLVSCLC